jgi:prepilin-type N-terminal cleavage/methylation domain-containing protein
MKNQKGFSLVELLVVVIIIAIIAAIAIPNLLASRRAANEASAISSLRTIHSSEATYFSTTGANASYGTLVQLSGQSLIDNVLGAATSIKSGYQFAVSVSTAAPAGSQYCGTATPTTAPPATNRTGDRWFGVSTPGVIYSATAAGTIACDAATGNLTGGTAIQ